MRYRHGSSLQSRLLVAATCGALVVAGSSLLHAQQPSAAAPAGNPETTLRTNVAYGPYNGVFLADGLGITKAMHTHEPLARAQAGWSMSLWMRAEEPTAAPVLLAGVGSPLETAPRYLGIDNGRPFFWTGGGHRIASSTPIGQGAWHFLAVSVDAKEAHLYADGTEVAHGSLPVGPADDLLMMAPTLKSQPEMRHFGGRLALVSLHGSMLTPEQVSALAHVPATLDTLAYQEASPAWPVQTHGQAGMPAPQDPSLLPHSAAAPQRPAAALVQTGENPISRDGMEMTLSRHWQMAERSTVDAPGAVIASGSFDASAWRSATVPGTVLTTLIDQGVYPDPDYGLNNMAIPESLSRQSFWYRTSFTAPASMRGRHLALNFNGINYHAEIWLNGKPLGEMTGAFQRRRFDISTLIKSSQANQLAVLIAPPPHSGIAHEQSLAAGAGDNGGMMMLDGPTFGATEGWDWIPGIRDRNMGIWQDVTLTAAGPVTIDTPRIITTLPLPETSRADVVVHVPLHNDGRAPVRGTLEMSFEGVSLRKAVTAPPGDSEVLLRPSEFPQLVVQHPRLWWPNGYGAPNLYTMHLAFTAGKGVSDRRDTRFGIRELTYELSLFDVTGHVRRVEVSPSVAALAGQRIVDQTHEGFRETPDGWVASLRPGAENSPAVRALTDTRAAPALVLRVNGVRIAVKGGAWGMDDMRKRVSRERLEPFFRLHREANLNMIRNWMGQNTEETFYDLADEYGLLVWNDFWDSTEDYNLEPMDPGLFLANAKDTIQHYRNHPSIAIWCGRNEGVPSPAINEGLDTLIAQNDGTRYYSADSNKINLHDSGPYRYQDPEKYFTTLSLGFAVELGLPSPPTLEAFQAFLPVEDQWPISDDWAYHDWHQGGNGDVAPFMATMTEEFGVPESLADFDRKAQMLNYESHRAAFEGFNAHLWAPNSGRLLWMTQPAWPSTVWQIFSHDYDTQASFYGVKKASEPVHVQMNLPDHEVIVVNTTEAKLSGLQLSARVFDLHNRSLLDKHATIEAAANATAPGLPLDLSGAMREAGGVVLVRLDLTDASGKPVSQNTYWLADDHKQYRKLNDLPPASLHASAALRAADGESHMTVTLKNDGTTAALLSKLTLVDAHGSRILPAYYSDNYVTLLPGDTREIDIAFPATAGAAHVKLRGWNVVPVDAVASQPQSPLRDQGTP